MLNLAEKAGPILIAEDDERVREFLSSWLRQKGFEVYEAATVPEAVELQHDLCKVCFIDLDLLGSDGLELIRHLKRKNNDAFVCVMSSPEMLAERANEIEDAQVFEVFPKPLDVGDIEHFLTKVARKEMISLWRINQPLSELNALPSAYNNFEKTYFSQLKDVMEDVTSLVKAQTGILF